MIAQTVSSWNQMMFWLMDSLGSERICIYMQVLVAPRGNRTSLRSRRGTSPYVTPLELPGNSRFPTLPTVSIPHSATKQKNPGSWEPGFIYLVAQAVSSWNQIILWLKDVYKLKDSAITALKQAGLNR
jgi:hypothetical protein